MLAAGAGARFGGPKALAREPDGTPWVVLAVRMLKDAGCDLVLVALGASGGTNELASSTEAPSATSTRSHPASFNMRTASTTHGVPSGSQAKAFGPPNRAPAPAASTSPHSAGGDGATSRR